MSKCALTAQQEQFKEFYLADPTMNVTAAYRAAYPKCSTKSAEANGARLIRNDRVRAAIDEVLAERAKYAEEKEIITKDYVLQCLKKSLKVNGNEIIDREGHERLTSDSGFNKAIEIAARYHSMLTDNKHVSGALSVEDQVKELLDE